MRFPFYAVTATVAMTRPIYLDYNATTPVGADVLEAMLPFLREDYGNPSSIHAYGRRAKGALIDARDQVAAFLSARSSEIVFTASGTEADNLAILGTLAAAEEEGSTRRHIVTSTIEHHAVLHVVQKLEKMGHPVSYAPVNERGQVSPDEVRSLLRPDTLLVSIMSANNETGVVQPVREIATAAHEAGAIFHTDAVQACGKLAVDVCAIDCDLLSLSAHKFYGPKGVGALFVKSGTAFRPVFRGGGQERARRPGTENLAGIVGLATAATLARSTLEEESRRLGALRDGLERRVAAEIPGSHSNGAGAERSPNTANFRFDEVDGEALVQALDRAGFAVSTGAACSAGAVAPSHVLIAMGLTPVEVQGSIRVSLGRFTEASDVESFGQSLAREVEAQRASLRAEVSSRK